MKNTLPAIVLVLFSLPRIASSATSFISLKSLLSEMTDTTAVARWPEPSFTVRQVSSYDRSRTAPDKPGWFANNDCSNFLRDENHSGRTERVMLDADGPGAIVRFFITSGGQRKTIVRLYLDGADEPAITWNSFDLFDCDLNLSAPLLARHPAPLGHGGSTLHLPIPYRSHCKITAEEIDPAHAGARYYNIEYRVYPSGTEVEPFSHAILESARADVDRVNQMLTAPPPPKMHASNAVRKKLAAGAETSLHFDDGPMAICELNLQVGADLTPILREQALRSTVLIAKFDNEKDAIWCPVCDFIGSGTGARPLASWYRTVDDKGNAVARWTMPYQHGATLTLKNFGDQPVAVECTAKNTQWDWNDRSMYFHTTWHQQVAIPTRPFRDWNFVTATGRGILVGDVMSVFNPVPAWYGEGDEKIWIDGESFPSHMGTGTEDYYNASWAPNPLFQTPFTNHTRIDESRSQGHNVYTRTRNLDAIPFEKSLQFDFEIWTWGVTKVDYATAAYWYALPGALSNIAPDPREARRPISAVMLPMAIPGAIECESMKIVHKTPKLVVEHQDMTPFTGNWSGNSQLLIQGRKVGDFVELAIPAPGGNPRRVTLFATKADDYGIIRFSINGQAVEEPFNGYAAKPQPSDAIPLGVFTPKDDQLMLRVELIGTDEKAIANKYLAALDAVVLSD